MKRLFLFTVLLACSMMQAIAQNDTIIYISDHPGNLEFCYENPKTVIVYGLDCESFKWLINGFESWDNPVIIDTQLGHEILVYYIGLGDCEGTGHEFTIYYKDNNVPTPFARRFWKQQGTTERLEAVGADSTNWFQYGYSFLWSTGETTRTIDVTQDTTYTCEISQVCGSSTRTFIVQDNCEIESVSVDPESNRNLVSWATTPAQAEYISQVTIARDGVDIATVPYTDGQFLDNIGSDLAARIYTITGVCTDGTLCPIPSLERGTIHMAFLPDINDNIEMTWNAPHLGGAPIHVGRYEICEYDPNTTEIAVIDFVSPSTMSYSCNQSMFNYGYPLIRAIIQDGRGEKDMLSNRTEDLVGIDEQNEKQNFKVYPNPATSCVTIEGTGSLSITNTLGQTVMMKEIDGQTNIELPRGIYFMKMNSVTRKIVVE